MQSEGDEGGICVVAESCYQTSEAVGLMASDQGEIGKCPDHLEIQHKLPPMCFLSGGMALLYKVGPLAT